MEIKSKDVQVLEQQWELLKLELMSLEDFYGRCNIENEINVIHDIQNLMNQIESGE